MKTQNTSRSASEILKSSANYVGNKLKTGVNCIAECAGDFARGYANEQWRTTAGSLGKDAADILRGDRDFFKMRGQDTFYHLGCIAGAGQDLITIGFALDSPSELQAPASKLLTLKLSGIAAGYVFKKVAPGQFAEERTVDNGGAE